MLGGLSRDRIRIYNTCAGYLYGQSHRIQNTTENWGMAATLVPTRIWTPSCTAPTSSRTACSNRASPA